MLYLSPKKNVNYTTLRSIFYLLDWQNSKSLTAYSIIKAVEKQALSTFVVGTQNNVISIEKEIGITKNLQMCLLFTPAIPLLAILPEDTL